MKNIKLINELSLLIEGKISERDTFKIPDLDDVILTFIEMNDNKEISFFKSEEMLNKLIDYIKLYNAAILINLF